MKKKINIEQLIGAIGLILTAVTIFLTFLSLQDSQKWKTAEFTASEYRRFRDQKSVRLVEQMLDYHYKNIPVLAGDSISKVDINDLLNKSLDTVLRVFNTKEELIRDAFDEYLDELSLFNRYIETDLIQQEQIKPYLDYYIKIIGDKNNIKKQQQIREKIWSYIRFYGFEDVEKLLLKFGYNIKA